MDEPAFSLTALTGFARRFVHRVTAIAENRFELLVLEVQEERDRLVRMVLLAVGVAALGLLAGIVWTAALTILFWGTHPLMVLGISGAAYAATALVLYRRLQDLRRHQQSLAATFDQLRKDRAALDGKTEET